jgi:hypothetical protein
MNMKYLITPVIALRSGITTAAIMASAAFMPGGAQAQSSSVGAGSQTPNTVYRCPNNEYTNDSVVAKAKKCDIVQPNISIMGDVVRTPPAAAGRTPGASTPASGASSASPNAPRVSNAEQKARDSDRRRILEDELRAAENKLADLKKDYNNGEPERRGDERNAAKYQERTSQLKADLTRAEADVTAIKREISNLKD